MRNVREFVTLPESWYGTASRWRDTPFTWKRWKVYSSFRTHDHCEFCLACISNRDRSPQQNFDERGCYRHAYYAEREDGACIWVCKECFERVQSEFGWTLQDDFPGAA